MIKEHLQNLLHPRRGHIMCFAHAVRTLHVLRPLIETNAKCRVHWHADLHLGISFSVLFNGNVCGRVLLGACCGPLASSTPPPRTEKEKALEGVQEQEHGGQPSRKRKERTKSPHRDGPKPRRSVPTAGEGSKDTCSYEGQRQRSKGQSKTEPELEPEKESKPEPKK